MAADLVSCVVPVFNGERYLADSLDSVFAQTHPEIEVIVVDDGSTDASAEVLEEFAGRIQLIRQANAGPAAARNAGIERASGAFVAFLDCDDLWRPERIERALAGFRAHPESDFCACHVENFVSPDVEPEGLEVSGSDPLPGYIFSSLMFRRSALEAVGALDARLIHGDAADWVLRANAAGLVHTLLADVLVRRRLHRSNWSQRNLEASHDEFLGIVKAHLDRQRSRA